jgi:hypothetical protein
MTPAEICELMLDDVEELLDYWRVYPPVRDLVAAFVGFKPKDESASAESKYMSADDLRRMMTATGGKVPGLPPF